MNSTALDLLDRANNLWEAAPNTNNERAATLLAAAFEVGLTDWALEKATALQKKVGARRVFLRRWSRK